MRKFLIGFLFGVLILILAGTSGATVYTFTPADPDLGDLDHRFYYTWGINWDLPEDAVILDAKLSFDSIRNWDANPNELWGHLLDSAIDGIGYDDQAGGDYFSGQGIELFHWENLPITPQNLTYTFSDSDISTLTTYLEDGNFGFGFDPDCHFYNNGVQLSITVPEPSTMLLFGAGLIGIAGIGRRKKLFK